MTDTPDSKPSVDLSPEAVERLARAGDALAFDWAEQPIGIVAGGARDTLRAMSARLAELEAAIKRQAGAARTLREHALVEVQHLKDIDRSEYFAAKLLDSEREANAILTDENAALQARAEAAEAALATLMNAHDRVAFERDALSARAAELERIEADAIAFLEKINPKIKAMEARLEAAEQLAESGFNLGSWCVKNLTGGNAELNAALRELDTALSAWKEAQ